MKVDTDSFEPTDLECELCGHTLDMHLQPGLLCPIAGAFEERERLKAAPMTTCEHGTPVDEDCPKCRAILSQGSLMDRYMTLKAQVTKQEAENTRLLNIIKGCPVCSELERNINTTPKGRT
jgi:hypothetical protein